MSWSTTATEYTAIADWAQGKPLDPAGQAALVAARSDPLVIGPALLLALVVLLPLLRGR